MTRLRKAGLDDAQLVSSMLTAIDPDEPVDPAVLRHRWQVAASGWTEDRFLVERDGRPAGFAQLTHGPWTGDDRTAELDVIVDPGHRRPEVFDTILGQLEERAQEQGANRAEAWIRELDRYTVEGYQRCAYARDRVSKAWELDLVTHRGPLLGERERTRALAAAQAVRLATLAEVESPQLIERLHQMAVASERDIPHTVEYPDKPIELFRSALQRPDLRTDRYWLALDGAEVAGLSFLKFPGVGNVWTGLTATSRAYRGKGLARAVKMETIGQAIELGVTRIRTDNDAENAPMLHINETLGYQPIPGWLSFLKPLP